MGAWTYELNVLIPDDDIESISRAAVRQEITGEERIRAISLWDIRYLDRYIVYAFILILF